MESEAARSSTESPNDPPRRTLPGKAKRAARSLLVMYVGVCLAMMLLERRLVYQPPPRRFAPLTSSSCEDVWFSAADGTKLHGVFFPAPESQTVVLYCHGNGEDVAQGLSLGNRLRSQLGANVFLFDYRGYGRSDGTPDEDGVLQDGLAAQRWLAERSQCRPDQIVLIGRSLGGGVATNLAARQGARGLVLQNTFADMSATAATHYPWLPVRWLMRNRYPSEQRISTYQGPLLQSHGTADRLVPYSHGRRLFDACPSEDKQFFTIEGGGHNDPEPPEYEAALQDWFDGLPTSTDVAEP